MTDPIVFEHADVQLRVDRGVFELFQHRNIASSYRTPLEWVRVQVQVRQRAMMLHFSLVQDPDEPIYGRLMGSVCSLATVEIPMADEPVFRAFFTELARLANRPIG
ncbi:hypothetical protein [Kribbella shirazensis]|jgi:hypothetical protein|uniref:Uncharacterized protein n=1 Tax=Kribbella shirazensis TaxID=1105143 RepID=A0A7X5VIG1_9ACTN|nr:hypothetical protein [Kribbella shirazensis]NIK61798.1 hypothetical protein [Kribbella shirazensis]